MDKSLAQGECGFAATCNFNHYSTSAAAPSSLNRQSRRALFAQLYALSLSLEKIVGALS